MKKRIMLTVAYDGTNYCGFQVQPNYPTIEGELNKHLSALLKTDIQVIGASRTDAGVHALCNVAVFDADTGIPAEKFAYALNQRLPEDIRIQASREVPADFHPRHTDTRKTYEYRIVSREFPLPTKRLYSYFTYHKLDVKKMQQAAAYLVGEHDFKSFCAVAAVVETTVRTVYEVTVEEQGEEIVIRVFCLQNMNFWNLPRQKEYALKCRKNMCSKSEKICFLRLDSERQIAYNISLWQCVSYEAKAPAT